jgi:plastocyanin
MSIHRRAFAQLLAALGVSAATPALAQAKTVEVSMAQSPKMRFIPDTVTIKAGDTVKWTNPHNISHTVTFDPSKAATAANAALPPGVAPFDSGPLEEEGTFSHTFTEKGTYKYVCVYHEAMGMVGTVVVS